MGQRLSVRESGLSNSSLVSYTRLSQNHSGQRNHAIDTITPHYMCWYTDGGTCAQSFVPASRQASANYCIGKSGDIVLNVDETNRAWTSGNAANDNRAVTIECANYMETAGGHKYGQLPDATWKSLVALCADICRRYGKTRLVYKGKADYSGLKATDMLLTKHKWFQDTDCPGPWFDGQFDRLAKEVTAKIGTKTIDLADVAARIHYDMTIDPANGYSQGSRWGGQTGKTKTLTIRGRKYTYKLGDYDCASSVITAWRLALTGTPYEGMLDGATYTGDMEKAFVGSGLFTSSLTAAKRGDLYLRPKTASKGGHTAMCQDGGSDQIFDRDVLTEFNRNEYHTATGGRVGDQDGGESVFRDYYDGPWTTVLHYNHRADIEERQAVQPESEGKTVTKPTQPKSKAKNTYGMRYKAHVQDVGWLPTVCDGQTAGTEGASKRVEAVRVSPPVGVLIDVYAHIEGFPFDAYYSSIKRGASKTVGIVGEGRRLEAIMIKVRKIPESLRGKTLKYQAHVQDKGWMAPVTAGHWAGTRGQGKRIEALKIWFE